MCCLDQPRAETGHDSKTLILPCFPKEVVVMSSCDHAIQVRKNLKKVGVVKVIAFQLSCESSEDTITTF